MSEGETYTLGEDFSQHALYNLKLKELRKLLLLRGLDKSGSKLQLVERLATAIANDPDDDEDEDEDEEEEENNNEELVDEEEQAEGNTTTETETTEDTSSTGEGGMTKLFVGQVPPMTTDVGLRKLFSEYGEVVASMILQDRATGASKGCGFITYNTRREAETAMKALDGVIKLPGAKRELIVNIAGLNKPLKVEQPKEFKLYVAMLCRKTTEDDIRQRFSKFGDIKEIYLMRDRVTNQSKGSAFIKFATEAECRAAINALHKKVRDGEAPDDMTVSFAIAKSEKKTRPQFQNPMMGTMPMRNNMAFGGQNQWMSHAYNPQFQNPNGMMQTQGFRQNQGMDMGYQQNTGGSQQGQRKQYGPVGANLFIYNVPDSYSDEDLSSLFSNFGNVLSATVQKNQNGESKGYAFVSYDTPTSAQTAITSMDGFMIGSKRLSVRVKNNSGGSRGGNRYTPY